MRQPVGVIGGSTVSAEIYQVARQVGVELAMRRLPIVCGGRTGVMEAVCEGSTSAGGVSIGILPERDMTKANSHCTIVLTTDLGNASSPLVPEGQNLPRVSRNRVIVGSAFCVFVISGTTRGTGDEVRFAREFGLRAFGLCDPACPLDYPNVWVDGFNGLFSTHESVAEALDAFDIAFPRSDDRGGGERGQRR